MTKDEVLVAGVNHFPIAGHYFAILEAAAAVDVKAYDDSGTVIADEKGCMAGYYIDRRIGGVPRFGRLEITCAAPSRTKFLVTDGYSGTNAIPLDVSDDSTRQLGIVSLNAASAVTNVAEATVGVAEGVVLAAAAARKSIRFFAPKTNADNITLGAVGITVATGAVVLEPGDTYIEDCAAGAAWSAISGTAGQKLRIQTVA